MAQIRVCRAAVVGLVTLLVACGTQTPTPEPTLPPRPQAPPPWRTVTSDDGAVHLVVPPDLIVINTDGSIHGYRDEGVTLSVAAVPASQLQPPRGETVEEWADEGGWLTAGQGQIGNGEVRRRDVLLPAGSAILLTSTYRVVGELGEVWTMLHVIQTKGGHALLQISGQGPPPDEVPEEIRLIRDLVRFSD